MEHRLQPMLAKDCGEKPPVVRVGVGWVMEPKLDGVRFLWERTEDGVQAYSGRNGRLSTGRYQEIADSLEFLSVGTVLDSELIVEGEQAPKVASALAHGKAKRAYVFDVLQSGDAGVCHLPWDERRNILEMLATGFDEQYVRLLPTYEPNQAVYEQWVASGLEGAILKRKRSTYRMGTRTKDWTKLKPQETTEAIVIGYEMGKGKSNQHKVGALKIRLIETGKETSAGCSCTVEEAESYMGKCLEVRHHGWTVHGHVRHPVKHRWRPDRDPVDS